MNATGLIDMLGFALVLSLAWAMAEWLHAPRSHRKLVEVWERGRAARIAAGEGPDSPDLLVIDSLRPGPMQRSLLRYWLLNFAVVGSALALSWLFDLAVTN